MATIQIILDAINNASRTFDEVAGSLETVNVAQDQAAESAHALGDAQLQAAQRAVDASAAYTELRDATGELTAAATEAGAATRALSEAELAAAAAGVRALPGYLEQAAALREVMTGAGQAAVGVRALSDAELAAAGTAARTQFAYTSLAQAQLDAGTAAITAAAEQEREAATIAAVAAAIDRAVQAQEEYAAAQTGAADATDQLAAAQLAEAAAAAAGADAAGRAAAGAAAAAGANNANATAIARAAGAAAVAAGASDAQGAALARVARSAAAAATWVGADGEASGRAAAAAVAAAAASNAQAAAATRVAAASNVAAASGVRAAAGADAAAAGAGRAFRGFGLWGTVMGGFFAKVPLWGGLLDGLLPKFATQVAGWHIMLDAIIEVLAVWGPAIIAAGAWGAAASDAINDVIRHMTSLHTVSDAFGQSIPPMTSNLEKLHDAVRPQVYSIFGDVLSVLTKRGGELNQVIMQTGQVFQQLAARAALAINSSQMSEFLHNSVNDVRLLGTAFGNLFGIIGNLIRMNQGWAGILLQVGTAFLGLIEHVTGLIIPLGQLLVLGHGFILWVGLAVTGVVKFGTVIAGWGAAIANGAAGLVSLVRMVVIYVQQVGLATAANEAMLATGGPFVWAAVAVAALAGLVFWLSRSKDATQAWGDSIQKAETQATSLAAGIAMVNTNVAQANAKLADATSKLNQAQTSQINLHTGVAAGAASVSVAYADQATKVRELTGIQKQQTTDQQTYNTRLADLAKIYGGVSTAQGLLIASGVTMAQMLDTSGAAWAMIKQQVEAAYRGYGAMAAQSGVLGNAMQVLDKQATDQYKAMQNLNQAWDTQTTAMTGTQSSFDTAAQGYETLANANQKLTLTLGKLKDKTDYVKAGIDQLTPSGIALNQAFSQQVGQVNSLADSWRSAGISQDQFKAGIAAGIAPLEQYAKGSQEATAQLVGLAQEAGYQGPVSLQALNQYLGITSGMLKNTAGDMTTMKSVANQATVQEALLTTAMQNQGSYIASQLIGDINQAILHYNGVAQAAKNYGTQVAQYGRQSAEAKTAQDQLTDSIIKAGRASGDTKDQIAAMIAKVLNIPKSVALQIVMNGEGSYTIGGKVLNPATGNIAGGGGHSNPGGGPMARGGMVRGGIPNKDSVPILAMAGELVVPKAMVDAGKVDHLRGTIPGFAAGGLVGGVTSAGNTSVLTGQYAVSSYNSFTTTFEQAMVHAMRGALAGAEQASAAASAGGGGGGAAGPAGAGGGSGRAALQAAAAARGWGSGAEWNALYAVEMREAGFRLNAQNPTSKAYGMAQFINGPSEYYQYGGDPNTAAGQATAMLNYIAQRYGDPIKAWQFELANGYYDKGGLLPPGLSLALNQTGSNEMVLPNGVIQGFTGGMRELHPFFWNLTGAIAKLTDATTKAATASTATAAAVTKQATVKTAPKPPTKIQVDQKKIADDKANAARLEARIKAVEQAIKDTPAKNKDARKTEENLLKQLQAALKTQNKGTGKDEAALAKEITKENKAMVASMQKAIAVITKLLGSGSAATSKSNALWTTLVADENKLAAAQKTLAGQLSGKSGGSSKITATLDKGSLSSFQAAEEKSFNAAVANLKAALAHPGSTPVKQITGDLATLMKRQAAEEAQYAKASADATRKNIEHLVALVHDELRTAKDKGLSKLPGTAGDFKSLQAALTKLADAAEAAAKAAVKSTSSGGGGTVRGTSPGSASYVTGTVADKRAESELAQLLTVAKQELAELKIMVAALAKIETEAAPAAQAKAIGPAVADAIQSTARAAAGGKTTRKG